jgi:DNA replication and repair protein RecF
MTGTVAESAPVSAAARAWLHRLSIRDFRNLRRVDLAPAAEGLALVGENGQGKTNFLEAIYYLQLLRSFRGARDQDLVTFGAAGFHVTAEVRAARAREVAVGFDRTTKRKRVTLNGTEPERLTDALGAFPAVIFSPQDAVLVSGAPSVRRRFLDVMLSLTSRSYLVALQRYRVALAHRNAAMREAAGAGAAAEARVAIWEPALAENGAVLWRARRAWVAEHAAHYSELCAAIGERGASRLRYVTHLDADDSAAEEALRAAIERRRAYDIRRGITHVGPHRDDLELALDGRDLRTYGSAGQQRTGAIALRLLEAATIRAHAGSEPVVLLDDPFAELDSRRAARMLDLLNAEGRGQTILAVPREADIPAGLTRLERWRIADGALTPDVQ